ncbi:hypothetical protein AbraIFM66951_010702 [Aspergillus brasiliensis]|uniref:Thioesterase domain-containing protein n=1 Tax=Aspergillus brasiliensis TaxID=319629 RepID=A0A9W5YVD3_9EURO|nr:hypothetical protein AbraCBS73388_011297 [Aspergillus brasiliensis]GKZ47342.1 hypothetical protein AbraIFM66951_010702 [Aspergillus brasiliensis]
MTEPTHSATFEKAIAVTHIDANRYSAYLDPFWCIGLVPHGGYTASVLYRTATTHFQRKAAQSHKKGPSGRAQEPIALQITFQRRTITGPAILTVQEIKLGARVSTIQVTLLQERGDDPVAASTPSSTKPETKKRSDGDDDDDDDNDLEVKVLAYVTLSPPEAEEGPAVHAPWDLVSPPMPPGSLSSGGIDFRALSETGVDGEWKAGPLAPPTLYAAKHLRVYSPASTLRPKTVHQRVTQVVDQWAQFAPGGTLARWSNEAVVYFADIFLAGLDRMGAMETMRAARAAAAVGGQDADGADGEGGEKKVTTGEGLVQFWYPTVTMNIDLKTRLPPDGVEWLHSRVVTRMLRGGRADLDVVMLDQQGQLIALSTQVALVVDPSRNVKGRGKSGKL